MSRSDGTGTRAMKDGGLRTLGPAILLGKVVAWVASLLMTVLLGCWLFMVKSTLRDALVLGCAVVLAFLALSAWALRRSSGNPAPVLVHRALADRAATGGSGPEVLPVRLLGASALLNGPPLVLYGGVMAVILPLALGVGTPTPTGKAAEIASSGPVVRALPVESVRNVVEDRHKNGSTYYCTVTVTLPPADGTGGGGKHVEFRSEWPDPAVVGGNVYVAYAPDRPELGAVGDNDRVDVDRQLSGRAMNNWWTGILGSAWMFLAAASCYGYLTTRRDQRFPRQLRGDEHVLRASISGYDGHGADKQRICLDTSTGPVQLHVHADNAKYVDMVGSAEGHLVWVPDRNQHGGRKGPHRTGAVFISDAGWFIPGGLAPEYEESARARADQRVPVVSTDESRLLDLDSGWILSIPKRLMRVLLLWTLCVVALALPVPSAAWRLGIGVAGTIGLLVYGLYVAVSQDTGTQEQSGSSQGAVGSAGSPA